MKKIDRAPIRNLEIPNRRSSDRPDHDIVAKNPLVSGSADPNFPEIEQCTTAASGLEERSRSRIAASTHPSHPI
jgi:hypothetical protein